MLSELGGGGSYLDQGMVYGTINYLPPLGDANQVGFIVDQSPSSGQGVVIRRKERGTGFTLFPQWICR